MSTRGLRHDAFQSLAALMRPLNDALKELGISLDGKMAEGRRVIVGPITIATAAVVANTFPVRFTVPLAGTVQAVHLARLIPANADEVPTTLGVPFWASDPNGTIALRYLDGLTASRTYQLWFECVMEA